MRRRAQPWLGTLVDISIADLLEDDALMRCFNLAFAEIARVHRLMSFHDRGSDVSRFNQAAVGASVEIHADTLAVIKTALEVAAATDGIFDVRCAPKLVAWGYLPQPEGGPGPGVGLALEPGLRIGKTAPVWIDLGGIAKGYAVDLAVAALKRAGVQSACVNAGGDMRVFGGSAYPVVVRDPALPTAPGLRLMLQDEALASSGTYFSRKSIGKHHVSALLDGRNSQPVTANFSASVRAPTCMLADALTKLVMVTRNPAHPALVRFGATAHLVEGGIEGGIDCN